MKRSIANDIGRLVPVAVVVALVALLVPNMFGSYWLLTFNAAVIYSLAAAGVGVLYGRLGLVSLTNFALLGVGGWVTLRVYHQWHLPFMVNVLLGGLFAAVIGTLVGLPALRLRGLYLALVTLLGAGAFSVVVAATDFPNGGTGFIGRGGGGSVKLMQKPSIARTDEAYFRFTVIIVALGFLLVWAHLRSRPGRQWAMIRRSQAAALSSGVNVTLYKTWAFTLSGFLAGVAGGLQAGRLGKLDFSDFTASASMLLFALTVSAGAFHLLGAVIAGVLARALPAYFSERGISADLANMIFGFLLLVSLTAAPEGAAGQLIGVVKSIGGKFRRAPATPEGDDVVVAEVTDAVPEDRYRPITVSITDLSVQFGGVRPLHELTLDLGGRIVGIVGPNGAGKTTLLNVLSGFVIPVTGRVDIDGTDLLALSPYERARWGLRRTFQTEQVVDNLTVVDNVDVMLDSLSMSRHERAAAVAEALAITGLTHRAGELARGLNSYERRMVEVARAVVGSPKLIVMDEPAAGLSSKETADFQRMMTSLPGRTGATIFLIDHDVDLIAALCEKTAVLDFGELIAYGATREVLDDERVRAAYLGVTEEDEVEVLTERATG